MTRTELLQKLSERKPDKHHPPGLIKAREDSFRWMIEIIEACGL